VEGRTAWALAGDVKAMAAAKPIGSIRLLPAFDPYVIGSSRHTESLMPGPFRPRVFRPQGWLTPVVTVDGRIEGVWTWERKGSKLTVAVEPFETFPVAVRKGIEAEAERLAGFLGGTLELSVD
jgi:hypothetical protein